MEHLKPYFNIQLVQNFIVIRHNLGPLRQVFGTLDVLFGMWMLGLESRMSQVYMMLLLRSLFPGSAENVSRNMLTF